MSITRSLAIGELDEYVKAGQKLEKLEIEVGRDQVGKLYERFAKLGNFIDPRFTSSGVKGLDYAFQSCLILAGKEEPKKVPVFINQDPPLVGEINLPFNFPISESDSIATATLRGYRMGLRLLAKASPLIEYVDSHVPEGGVKTLAAAKLSDAVLVGQHLTPETPQHFETACFGAFPSEAERLYSFVVQNSISVTGV